MEHRRSYKLGRTSSVTKTLNGGLGIARQADFQNLPLHLVQVHVVDRVLGILWRAEGNERESTVFGAWKTADSERFGREVASSQAYSFVVKDLSVRWAAGLR